MKKMCERMKAEQKGHRRSLVCIFGVMESDDRLTKDLPEFMQTTWGCTFLERTGRTRLALKRECR
jgi:hypothetical protein